MNQRLLKIVQLVAGGREPPAVAARFVLGVAFPAVVVVYALLCIATRQATVIARGGLTQVIGLPAASIGVAYAAIGVCLYVYVCWDDHPQLAGLRDVALQALLLVAAIALAATFGLVLI